MTEITSEELLRVAREYVNGTSQRQFYRNGLARRLEPFLLAYPGQMFVQTLRSTEALSEWLRTPNFVSLTESERRLFLRALRGFSSWLLRQGLTEHDVYFYLCVGQVVSTSEVPIINLKLNLQKEIARLEAGFPKQKTEQMRDSLRAAHRFNLYRNRAENLELCDEELLVGWLRETSASQAFNSTRSLFYGLVRFCRFVGDNPSLPDVGGWLSRYRSMRSVVRNLDDLSRVERVRFRSGLGSWFESYLKFCEGRKMRLDGIEVHLRWLDRVASRHGVGTPEGLTRSMLLEYLEENSPAPVTYNQRLARLRCFRRFLKRRGVELTWPSGLSSRPVPPFRPHLYTLTEIGQLLEALEHMGCAGRRNTFYWAALRLVVFLLYAGGMRLNEPLRLRIKDVDLDQRLLFIHNTKFYKQRWVPLGPRASLRLSDYFDERCRRYPQKCSPDDPFFLNSRGGFIRTSCVELAFLKALDKVGIKGRGTRSRPRLHDLRHTAAVHKLYQWYSEGKDVQNKLPLLSAYLGHERLQHTEKYLYLTEDLLRLAGSDFRVSFEKIVGQVEPA